MFKNVLEILLNNSIYFIIAAVITGSIAGDLQLKDREILISANKTKDISSCLPIKFDWIKRDCLAGFKFSKMRDCRENATNNPIDECSKSVTKQTEFPDENKFHHYIFIAFNLFSVVVIITFLKLIKIFHGEFFNSMDGKLSRIGDLFADLANREDDTVPSEIKRFLLYIVIGSVFTFFLYSFLINIKGA